jgi:DNA helicase HerA-like ATPase
MVIGSTGKGKSTFVEYMLHHILHHSPDAKFIIINPHHRKGQWGLTSCIGKERNYPEIEKAFPKILELLTNRYKEYFEDKDLLHAPIYIIIDELPAIAQNTTKDSLGSMLKQISSEGRKVQIYLILLTQSTMVKQTGFERASDMLENFIRVTVSQPNFTYVTEIDGVEQERTSTFGIQKVEIPEDRIYNCF